MGAKDLNMEALSPRDANAQRVPRPADLKSKAVAQLKANKEKEHPPPPPGNVVEPPSHDRKDGAVYQIGKLLGKGGFAICYEGKQAGASKKYALKVVKCQMPPKMEQKFQTELQIHSKMRQANIVQFHRAFTFENCTYLILELCPNGSLMDMVKKRRGLTEPEVRFYTVQIAGAIKYMHSKGIIHRDLKMGNIFLDKHMNTKIGDFGLAALLMTGKDMQIMRRTTLCGTPNYIAPEILEKGKKGHDHMVDIWSLGIIVFAMLTSKPPFQSSTTDEIYRRARNRDYEWPSPEQTKKYISQEAKDLVATMLQDAEERPDPDTIVEHPFFLSGYMPTAADISGKLKDAPPGNPAFYNPLGTPEAQVVNAQHVQEMCSSCGVGPWSRSRIVMKSIWREMADEEQNGLTPIIPLAEGIVYRPYDEVRSEQRLQQRLVLQQQQQVKSQAGLQAVLDKTVDELSNLTLGALPPKPPVSAPPRPLPQSFAAQQRAQGRPMVAPNTAATQTVTETAPRGLGAGRPRTRREAVAAPERTSPDELGADKRPATRATRHALPDRRAQTAEEPVEETVPPQKQASKQAPTSSRQKPSGERLSLFGPSDMQEYVPGTGPDEVLDRLRKLQAELERALNARSMALVSTRTKTPPSPRIVVKWVDYTNKFGLGYILNDGSVGCILRNIPTQEGSTTALLPPACMLIHGAERHCLHRDDPTYRDRHQIVPMTEGIYFYENNAEDGFSRVRVEPERFSVPVGPDGLPGKLTAGKDIYDHRKRERIVLWKKFANYMIAYGREMESQDAEAEDALLSMPTTADPKAVPSDVVIFYQRFGDAMCWMFCDGHMQFNFPDHTKIVLDETGTWCHFWHLPEDAAKRLGETGSLVESALDKRNLLSYPLQTLLNFAVVPKSAGGSSSSLASARIAAGTRTASNGHSSSSRQRPEIGPELRDIPAANQFRRKVEFIRDVMREWTAGGGIGNSDMSRERRLRWTGMRETCNVPIPAKHVWVTIGSRRGDQRLSAYVDPRRPTELGEDIEETKRRG